jgi:dTDP-glucose 4,6-dehydratase
MRVLVIGSEGTIGVPLVAELASRGHEVTRSDLMHKSGRYLRCDVRDYRQVERLLVDHQPHMVYMLAAEFGRHNGEMFYEQCWSTNVIGGRHVMELCTDLDIPLVFMSSSEAYGETPQELMRESDTDKYPLRHHNDYAMSKWINEQQIMNMERTRNLQCVRVRFFNAYGPGEYYHPFRSVVCLFCHAAITGEPYTVYEGYHRVFMYITDAVRTLANIAENFDLACGKVYNIGGTEYRSVAELDDIIRYCLGEHFRSEVEYMPVDGHNTVNKRPDVTAAQRDLGHELTVSLDEGVRATIEWFKENA